MYTLLGKIKKKLFVFFNFIFCVCFFLNSKEASAYSLPQEAISLWIEGCELSREHRYEHAQDILEKAQILAQEKIQESSFEEKKICLSPGICRIMADRIACLLSFKAYEQAIELAEVLIKSDRVPFETFCYGLQAMAECFKKLNKYEERLRVLDSLAKVSPRSASLYIMPGLAILALSSPAFNESIKQVEKTHEILERICKESIAHPTFSVSEVVFFKIPAHIQTNQLAANDLWLTEFKFPVEVLYSSKDYTFKCFLLWEQLCALNALRQTEFSKDLFKELFKELHFIAQESENFNLRGLESCLLLDGGVSFIRSIDTDYTSKLQKVSYESLKGLVDLNLLKPFHLSRSVIYRALNDKTSFWSQKVFKMTQSCHVDRFVISSGKDVSLIESTCQSALIKLFRAMNNKIEPLNGVAIGQFSVLTPSGSILISKERAKDDVERFFQEHLVQQLGDPRMNLRGSSASFIKEDPDLLLPIADREFFDL